MSAPVFVSRCRVCGTELQTDWGPETHSEAEAALRAHIEHHSFRELQAFALRWHVPVRAAAVQPPEEQRQ